MQQASTSDLIFDVASLISILSASMTLSPGDVRDRDPGGRRPCANAARLYEAG